MQQGQEQQQPQGPDSFYCPISGELMKDPVIDYEGEWMVSFVPPGDAHSDSRVA